MEGLTEWQKLIHKDGFLAVTHISWLKELVDIPEEPKKYWNEGRMQFLVDLE